jgi:hypothetical protein
MTGKRLDEAAAADRKLSSRSDFGFGEEQEIIRAVSLMTIKAK